MALKRVFACCLILLCTCISDKQTQAISPITNLFSIRCDQSSPCIITPPNVSEKEFPSQPIYYVRTRIVIQVYAARLPGSDKIMTLYGVTPYDVFDHLKTAEKIFENVGLKFIIEECVFQQYNPDYKAMFVDAAKHQNCMSVYYLLPGEFELEGLSSMPWETSAWGICLAQDRREWTLAHEIGHYFGLLHTFDSNGDYCDDTEPQKKGQCTYYELLPNCRNVMSYCDHTPKYITPQQVDRMKKYTRYYRRKELTKDPRNNTDYLELFSKIAEMKIRDLPNQPEIKMETVTSQPATSQPTTEPCDP